MNTTPDRAAVAAAPGARMAWDRLTSKLDTWISHNLLALSARFAIAGIFFMSARTKVEGWLTIKDSTFTLFAEDYKVPLLPTDLAAHLATYAEHLFPVLLVFGLATRLSALALLGMTAVIQIFVYPDAWPTHLSWAALLLYLIGRGGGDLALDRLLCTRQGAAILAAETKAPASAGPV